MDGIGWSVASVTVCMLCPHYISKTPGVIKTKLCSGMMFVWWLRGNISSIVLFCAVLYMTTMRNDMHTRVSSFFVDIVFGFFLCSLAFVFCVGSGFSCIFAVFWVWVDFFWIGFCFLGIRKDIHSDECLFCVQWVVKSLKSFNHKDHYAILLHNAMVVRIVFWCQNIGEIWTGSPYR